MVSTVARAPRSTAIHCGSANALDQRVVALPSIATPPRIAIVCPALYQTSMLEESAGTQAPNGHVGKTENMSDAVMVFTPAPQLTVTIEKAHDRAELHVHAGGQGVWQTRMINLLGARVTLCAAVGGEV